MRGFDPLSFEAEVVGRLRSEIRGEALAAVSGGVDSAVAAVLARRAVGDRLHAVVLDTGFLREGEAAEVARELGGVLDPQVVDLSAEFSAAVSGLSDPEEKRVAFREAFYSALAGLAGEVGARWLVQGTIAPDVIETVGGIKTQHNVLEQVGIRSLERYGFSVVEPLRDLYKDQVRELARHLGLPRAVVERQPFPGPGLLVRCLGECTPDKLGAARAASGVVEPALLALGCSQTLAAALEDGGRERPDLAREVGVEVRELDARATGVKGDQRRLGKILVVSGVDYPDAAAPVRGELLAAEPGAVRVLMEVDRWGGGRLAVAARAVSTEDFMTAEACLPPPGVLGEIAEGIRRRVPGAGALYYDLTPKPPATIEFE